MLKRGGRVAVVGGSGVGKTTTLVKLAAHFARMHGAGSVALVNTDNIRVGASEQLRRYARLMGLAVCNVRAPSDLGRAFERLADRKLVLVDTAGASYHDLRLMDELKRLHAGDGELSCYLTVSCNTQLAALERTAAAFASLDLQGCILTKADEAVSLGPALSFAARHELPVSFVTTGPNVPADIRIAHAQWLVQRSVELLEESRRLGAAPAGRHALNRR
jgi:flagellar biosynthesis protein FlhF